MQKQPGILLSVLIIALLLASSVWSKAGSAKETNERVIFIGHFNFDCYPDTIKGERAGVDGYLPSRILWGQSNKLDVPCNGKTPLSKRVKQTQLIYPGWNITGASVAFQSINGDSLTDIILHVKVKIPGDDVEMLRSIALFGQHSINAVPVIHISEIERFQAEPFFAIELVRGAELTRKGKRDLSGSPSYILESINIDLDRRDSVPPPVAPLASIDQREMIVRVYPNPTTNTLSIEAAELAVGRYILQVISVSGEVELREEVSVQSGEGLQKTLDLHHFATGYYIVRIENGEGIVGTWPVIFTQ